MSYLYYRFENFLSRELPALHEKSLRHVLFDSFMHGPTVQLEISQTPTSRAPLISIFGMTGIVCG